MTPKHKKLAGALAISTCLGVLFYFIASRYLFAAPEGDAGCFSAIGHHIHHGAVLYKDVYDNKAPGIFFLHAGIQTATQFFTDSVPFQGDFSTNGLLQLLALLSVLIPMGYISYHQFPKSPATTLFNLILLALGLAYVTSYWPAMFTGGFTEEIGSYFFFSGFAWMYLSHSRRNCGKGSNDNVNYSKSNYTKNQTAPAIASGIFVGLAVWVKEPFVFFIPALFPMGFSLGQKQKFQWLLGFLTPWLFYACYCTSTGSWNNYFQYLQFASDYAASNSESLLVQNPVVQLAALFTENNPIDYQPLPKLGKLWISFLLLTLIVQLARIIRPLLKTKSISILYVFKHFSRQSFLPHLLCQILLILGGFYFSKLGANNGFPHYQLPLLFSLVFCTWFIATTSVETFISCFNSMAISTLPKTNPKFILPTRKLLVIATALSWYMPIKFAVENYKLIQSQNYPPLLHQSVEATHWKEQLSPHILNSLTNNNVYVDDPQAGRFYTHFQSSYQPPFPCPYYVYFYSDITSQDVSLTQRLQQAFYTNQTKQHVYLQSHPPNLIITGNHAGFLTTNSKSKQWFYTHYKAIDTLEYLNHTFHLYQQRIGNTKLR